MHYGQKTNFKKLEQMKNLKLILAALVFSAFTVNAQTAEKAKHTEDQKKEHKVRMDENKKLLALTPAQETSFKEINKKYMPEMKAVKKEHKGNREEKMKEMNAIRDRKNQEVKAILSETQYKTYLDLQKERKENWKNKRKEKKQM